MTHEHDPATCDVALLRDAADRRVAQIGTECVTEEDARTLQDTAEAMGDRQALLWLGHSETTSKNWYKACGYSERFIAICEHFRARGYDYLWFDADRETPVGQGPAAVGPLDAGHRPGGTGAYPEGERP